MKPILFNARQPDEWLNKTLRLLTEQPLQNLLTDNLSAPLGGHFEQTTDGYILKVAVPGMCKDDLKLEVDDTILKVIGSQEQSKTGWFNLNKTTRNTHLYSSYKLPKDANTNSIKAKCLNGLLTINIPKLKAQSTKRVIPVDGTAHPIDKINWWHKLAQPVKSFYTRGINKLKQWQLKF